MLLNAQYGLEVGTELLWEYIDRHRKPTMLAVNQLDSDKAHFNQTLEQARQFFCNAVTVMQSPVNQGLGFDCIIDLLKMTMYQDRKSTRLNSSHVKISYA